MGLDYVDIFYSHRVDPSTPLDETMGALADAHRQGKALYVGISSYSAQLTRKAYEILKSEGVPLLIHQPSYSLLNRWVEQGLLDTLGELGVGCIAFSPLAQGMLTSKYLRGVPDDARAVRGKYFPTDALSEQNLAHVRALNDLAKERGQTLAQMAIAWVLRDPKVTSALIGARTVEQLEDSLAAVRNLQFSDEELAKIDCFATDAGIDIWTSSRIKEVE
jgi:L-glyceraldehyde 3-phosphate reductase